MTTTEIVTLIAAAAITKSYVDRHCVRQALTMADGTRFHQAWDVLLMADSKGRYPTLVMDVAEFSVSDLHPADGCGYDVAEFEEAWDRLVGEGTFPGEIEAREACAARAQQEIGAELTYAARCQSAHPAEAVMVETVCGWAIRVVPAGLGLGIDADEIERSSGARLSGYYADSDPACRALWAVRWVLRRRICPTCGRRIEWTPLMGAAGISGLMGFCGCERGASAWEPHYAG